MQDFSSVFKDLLTKITALSKRLTTLETSEYNKIRMTHAAALTLNNQALVDGVIFTSGDLRGANGVGANAAGIMGTCWITPIDTSHDIYFSASGDTPDQFSQRYRWVSAADTNRQHMSQFVMIPLGSDGKISLLAVGSNTNIYLAVTGWWM